MRLRPARRSWRPFRLPLRQLLIVGSRRHGASKNTLDPLDPEAAGVARVDVPSVQAWTGSPGMLARRPGHVRPITPKLGPLPARGGLYTVCLSSLAEAADT